MTNYFLSVNKDLFKLGLNPTEILVLAQVMEYNRTTGNCFISDKVLAEMFGVSDKTISRTMKALEERGFIARATKSVKGGKERHITVNINNIEQALSKDKMTVDSDIQQTKCPLSKDNLSVDKGQNDLIKDNRIDNLKDNYRNLLPVGNKFHREPEVELKEISPEALLAMGAKFELTEDNLIRIIDTGAIFRIKE